MSRIAIFLYGVISYAVFFGVFLYGVGFIGGFLTPTMLDGPAARSLGEALRTDLGLLALFAVQHSGMARPAFKRWLARYVPESAERSTYVLISSLCLVALYVWWSPIGYTVWRLTGAARGFVIGLYLFGWALLLYATFLIDHFDLFGLKQVWRKLAGHAYEPPKFRTPGLYKLVRHPIYIGWLTIFWSAPVMTYAHLLFAIGTTAYILVAIQLEERDLIKAHGETYEAYRRRTPALVPKLWFNRRGQAPHLSQERKGDTLY